MAKKQTKVYTVAQINSLIKSVLESNLPGRFSISAEISGWKVYASGHAYFTLKDDSGIMPGVMWRSSLKKQKFVPENGMAVVATGYIDIYEPSGRYQFYVDRMEPAGVGALQLAFDQLVAKLKGEGLFDEKHKKPLPAYPMRIGIVTSGSGAALHDIADSVYNRWPCARMLLYPVLVQGDKAAGDISKAIRDINRGNKKLNLDLLIVGRGGGSLEDLWAFNEEVVARAIFDSKIPIISAVGHEVDTTIADFVADVRASTPTKAGVVAVPDMEEILDRLEQTEYRLGLDLERRVDHCGQLLKTVLASSVFKNPLWMIANASQQLDELSEDIAGGWQRMFGEFRARLDGYLQQVQRIEPHRLIGSKRLELSYAISSANIAINNVINKKQLQLTAVDNRLAPLDPKSVLNRGYSITMNEATGKLVAGPGDVGVGDVIVTEMAGNKKIESKVTKT